MGVLLTTPAILKGVTPVGGAYSPTSLYAASEAGAWYDPSDLTTQWTNTAGTLQAVVGNRIRRIDDKSGNAHHLTQAGIEAFCPILRQDGNGKYYWEFLFGDVRRIASTNGAVGCSTAIIAARMDTGSPTFATILSNANEEDTGIEVVFTRNGTTSAWWVSQGANGSLADATHMWRDQVQTTALTLDETHIYSCDGTDNAVSPLELVDGLMLGQNKLVGAQAFTGRVYGLIVRGGTILTTTERNNAEAWLADKAGVTI